MPRSEPTARFLIQRLIVIQANPLASHELGGHARETARINEGLSGFVVLTNGSRLNEGFAVGVAFL